MIKIKDLVKGQHLWKSYPNGEEQEFIVYEVCCNEGKYYAELDYADDDYIKDISEEDEKDFYFK